MPLPVFAQNTVNITSPVTGDVYGNGSGANNTVPPATNTLAAIANTVNINGSGSVTGYVYGGLADTFAPSAAATAQNNKVNVSGSGASVDGFIYGGKANSDNGTAATSGNSVNISNSAVVNGYIVGGYTVSDGAGTSSGNSVIVNKEAIKESAQEPVESDVAKIDPLKIQKSDSSALKRFLAEIKATPKDERGVSDKQLVQLIDNFRNETDLSKDPNLETDYIALLRKKILPNDDFEDTIAAEIAESSKTKRKEREREEELASKLINEQTPPVPEPCYQSNKQPVNTVNSSLVREITNDRSSFQKKVAEFKWDVL